MATPMQDKTFRQIAEIVQNVTDGLDLTSLGPATVLSDIGINSMKRILIIGRIEKTFDIEFSADELISEQLETLGGLCGCVAAKTGTERGAPPAADHP